jgi:branched-chain amino acid transport system substrate-binding protein
MKRIPCTILAACALTFGVSTAQAQPVKIANLVELSGTGATAGTMFKSGIELAAKDINAGGGILGRKVEYVTMDTQTTPGVAKALAIKAIDDDVFAVFGPVFTGSVVVSAAETRRAEIPNFTAAAGASVTQQGNPYIFRTGFSQAMSMPKVARYIAQGLKAKSIAVIYVNNDFGKPGRDAVTKALEPYGVKVVADVSTDPGQVDMSGPIVRARQANADAIFVYLNEEESARALRELRKQGWAKPIVGDVTLISQKVIELAGDAANGATAHVGLTADAPQATIKKFDQEFQKEFKTKADHNGLKGYSAMYVVKAVTEQIGKFDQKAFAQKMHGIHLSAKQYPGILLDVSFDQNGDLDRESFMTTVVNGKQVVTATLPAASPK